MREKYTAVFTDSDGKKEFSIVEIELVKDSFLGKDTRESCEYKISGIITTEGLLEGISQGDQGGSYKIKMQKTQGGYNGKLTVLKTDGEIYKGSYIWKKIK